MLATEISPDPAWALSGLAHCMALAVYCGELISARALATSAACAMRRVEWEHATDEQCEGLLVFAYALCRLGDDELAKTAWDLFACDKTSGALRAKALRHSGMTHQGPLRARAMRRHAAGLVAIATGDRLAAGELLAAAKRDWLDLRYHWRASEAASDLSQLASKGTGRCCEAQNAARSSSWPAGELIRSGVPAALLTSRLSARDRQILKMVLSGLTDPEIASRCNISAKTVRNIVHGFYGIFGVHKRSQLIARCLSAEAGSFETSEQGRSTSSAGQIDV